MLQGSLKYMVADILDNILNLLDAGFAILDKELNIIWVNERLRSMLNLNYDPVGKTCREVYN
ncbi:MAG TPA: hypothetical protein ACFYEE_07635, partial [Candidatus Wujingus californicus]